MAEPRPLFGQPVGAAEHRPDGTGTAGTAGDDIGAIAAWQHGTGSPSVVVADIDSGLDTAHPDLAPNLWVNPGENCSGCRSDGVDNDGNGYVDDWRGWDFVENDNVTNDPAKHGTHTAGTIGAAGDNGIGVIGVDPHVSLMPLRFLGGNGVGTTADAVEAMLYAARNGARVINGSWGGGEYSQAMVDALAEADVDGALYVASAGNSANDAAFYPAATDLPNVISTAATDQSDGLAWFSTFGDTVDLAAPGVHVLSTWPGGGYQYADGTSMAAPHVSGSAALLFSQHPGATPETVKALLFATVKQLPSLQGKVLTGGRLDLGAAADCSSHPRRLDRRAACGLRRRTRPPGGGADARRRVHVTGRCLGRRQRRRQPDHADDLRQRALLRQLRAVRHRPADGAGAGGRRQQHRNPHELRAGGGRAGGGRRAAHGVGGARRRRRWPPSRPRPATASPSTSAPGWARCR